MELKQKVIGIEGESNRCNENGILTHYSLLPFVSLHFVTPQISHSLTLFTKHSLVAMVRILFLILFIVLLKCHQCMTFSIASCSCCSSSASGMPKDTATAAAVSEELDLKISPRRNDEVETGGAREGTRRRTTEGMIHQVRDQASRHLAQQAMNSSSLSQAMNSSSLSQAINSSTHAMNDQKAIIMESEDDADCEEIANGQNGILSPLISPYSSSSSSASSSFGHFKPALSHIKGPSSIRHIFHSQSTSDAMDNSMPRKAHTVTHNTRDSVSHTTAGSVSPLSPLSPVSPWNAKRLSKKRINWMTLRLLHQNNKDELTCHGHYTLKQRKRHLLMNAETADAHSVESTVMDTSTAESTVMDTSTAETHVMDDPFTQITQSNSESESTSSRQSTSSEQSTSSGQSTLLAAVHDRIHQFSLPSHHFIAKLNLSLTIRSIQKLTIITDSPWIATHTTSTNTSFHSDPHGNRDGIEELIEKLSSWNDSSIVKTYLMPRIHTLVLSGIPLANIPTQHSTQHGMHHDMQNDLQHPVSQYPIPSNTRGSSKNLHFLFNFNSPSL